MRVRIPVSHLPSQIPQRTGVEVAIIFRRRFLGPNGSCKSTTMLDHSVGSSGRSRSGMRSPTGEPMWDSSSNAPSRPSAQEKRKRGDVTIRWSEDALLIEVADNGRGRTAGEESRKGYGTTGMQERAASVGGSLEVGSRAEGGFAVRAVLPLRVVVR